MKKQINRGGLEAAKTPPIGFARIAVIISLLNEQMVYLFSFIFFPFKMGLYWAGQQQSFSTSLEK